MLRLLLAVLAGTISACSPQVTFVVGPRFSEGERRIAATIAVMQPVGEHGVCGWVHSSEVVHGPPFNDDDEVTFDAAQCGWQWGGR